MIMTSVGRYSTLALPLAGLLLLAPIIGHTMEFRGIAMAGFNFGGDSLSNVPSLSNVTIRKIRANEGGSFAAGMSILNNAGDLAVEATVGTKSAYASGRLQSYEFRRTMLEVLGVYGIPLDTQSKSQIRFGAGPTLHYRPTVEETGSLLNQTTKFDDALGLVAQIDGLIAFGRSGRVALNVGVRYTYINYEARGIPTVNGSGAGVFIGARFPVGL